MCAMAIRAIEAKLDRTARELVEAARDSEADEIVVIGHSLGAVLAIDLLDRALQLEPRWRRKARAIVLISVGSSILKIGLHSAAGSIPRRRRARRLRRPASSGATIRPSPTS